MWKRVKQLARLSMDEVYMELAILGGGFAFGTVLVAIILKCVGDATEYFCLGSLMGIGALVMGVGVLGGMQFYARFQLALSMQRSRTHQIFAEIALLIVRVAVMVIIEIAMIYAEPKVLGWIFPKQSCEFDLTGYVTPRYAVVMVVVLTLISLLMSAVYNRYGVKGWLILYFSVIGLCFFLPRLIVLVTDHEENPVAAAIIAIITAIIELPAAAHTVLNLLLAIGIGGVSVRMLMRSAVQM